MQNTIESTEEARKLWTDALRSGKYEQCTGRLCDIKTNTYCCLGVACELFADRYPDLLTRVDLDPTKVDGGRYYKPGGGSNESASLGDLPAVVQTWLGLATSIGDTRPEYEDQQLLEHNSDCYDDQFAALANLNDVVGLDFWEIADVIDGGNIETV